MQATVEKTLQTTVEKLKGLERRLQITVPKEEAKQAMTIELKKLASNRRFDGFRKGKVPLSIVEKKFGASVRRYVLNEIMAKHYSGAVRQEGLDVAGPPNLEIITNEPNEDFVFSATIEVVPELSLAPLEDISIDRPIVETTEADVDQFINLILKQRGQWELFQSKIPKKPEDMRAYIDFTGMLDGKVFEGGEAKDFILNFGKKAMIAGFEEHLFGCTAGDEKAFDITFPEDYPSEQLKGKLTHFTVKVNKVETLTAADLNEALLKEFDSSSIEDFRKEIRMNMERELKNAVTKEMTQKVLDALIESNPVEIPKAWIAHEEKELLENWQRSNNRQLTNEELKQLPPGIFLTQAKHRAMSGFLLQQIIKMKSLVASDESVQKSLEERASVYEKPEEFIEYYKNNENMLKNVRDLILQEQAVNAVIEVAKVSEVKKSYNEMMRLNQE